MINSKKGFPLHPDYKTLIDKWEFYLYSYEGGQEYKDFGGNSYLYSHAREQKDDYNFRAKRAVFESISAVVIDTYKNHIRRKGIERDDNENKNYQEFFENCDLENHNLDYFMLERAFVPDQIFGFTYVVADLPESGKDIKSDYERKSEGIRPYLTVYYPTETVNWQWRNGKFDWIVFKETEYQNVENPLNLRKTQSEIVTYKLWTPTEWVRLDKNSTMIDEPHPHSWKEIPIAVFHNRESILYNLPVGLSAIKLIAELDRKCFNLSSLLDEFLYRQCFAQLVLDKEMLGKIIETGTTRVLLGDLETLQPYFLEPPTGAAQFIVSERDRTVDSAYRFAMIRGDSYVSENQSAQSGVAKAYDLHDSQQNIAQKSLNCQAGENRLHKLLEPFHGEMTATYPTEFDIKTLNEELEESLGFLKADFGSVTYNREKTLKLIQRDLEGADPELIKKIRDEIEEVNPGLSFEQRMRLLQENLYDTFRFMLSVDPELKNLKPEEVKNQFQENMKLKQEKAGIKPEPTLQELIGG